MTTPERGRDGLRGADLIAAERRRQIEVEGWTPEHDREHGASRLLRAGDAYRWNRVDYWPWDREWWKPKDHLSNLIRAGALYAAAGDVDVIDRTSQVEAVAREIDGILDAAGRLLAEHPATGDEGEHHPKCYQRTGVPDDLPAGLCDCRVLRMLDASTPPASDVDSDNAAAGGAEVDALWALRTPSLWESPDERSIPTLLAAIGQALIARGQS